jgi:hypothetical protein
VKIRSKRRPSNKSLVKGLVPVACQSGIDLKGVLRNPGAGVAWPKVLKPAQRRYKSSSRNRRNRSGSPMDPIVKSGHNSVTGL